MDKKEIRQKAMEKAIKVVVTSEQVEAALRMGFTRDEDILVLTSLHRPQSQRTIEGILNKYSQNVKNKSIWVDNLIQSSDIAKDMAKRNINYKCYVIDESNIHFMRMWADLKPTQEDINNNPHTQEEKELRERLLAGLNEKTIDELIRELSNPELKNRDVAWIYKRYNKEDKLKNKGIHFNVFCEAVIKYLNKEDCGGWNYNAIRYHLK